MKGKPCGKGYIPRAKKCLSSVRPKGASPQAKGASGTGRSELVRTAITGLGVGALLGTGAVMAGREMGTQVIGLVQAGPKWTQKNPPGKPWINDSGVLEFPELKGFGFLKNRAIKETKDPSIYPFSSGILGLVFKSREDDSFVLKVPKETVGRTFAQTGAKREWNNLVVAEASGVTPKPLAYYPKSGSIKMENLFNKNRPGGVPRMMTEAMDEVDPNSIVEGFTRLHSTGVSHGDAGRSNLMVQQDGRLLFIDLGNVDINDPAGAKADVGRMKRHLYDIKKERGVEPSPSPAAEAIEKFDRSGGTMSDYIEYRERLAQIYTKNDSGIPVPGRIRSRGVPSKKCPGGYSIPADKSCRGSREAFQGATKKLKRSLGRDVETVKTTGVVARRAAEFLGTPEARAAIKKAREVYGRIPETGRREIESRAVRAVGGGLKKKGESRLSEAKEVALTGGAYIGQEVKSAGQKMIHQARKTFRKRTA